MGEKFDKMKGKIKQAGGGLTGDRGKQAEGYIDEMKGKIKEKIEDAKETIREKRDELRREHEDAKKV